MNLFLIQKEFVFHKQVQHPPCTTLIFLLILAAIGLPQNNDTRDLNNREEITEIGWHVLQLKTQFSTSIARFFSTNASYSLAKDNYRDWWDIVQIMKLQINILKPKNSDMNSEFKNFTNNTCYFSKILICKNLALEAIFQHII